MFFKNNINITFTWRINQFFLSKNFFLFPKTFSPINSISLSSESWIFCHIPSCLFLLLFRMLWMLVIVYKLKHMTCRGPHVSGITTCGTFLTDFFFFSAFNEISPELVTHILSSNIKNINKKLWSVRPKALTRRTKRRKRRQLQSLMSFKWIRSEFWATFEWICEYQKRKPNLSLHQISIHLGKLKSTELKTE